MSAGGGIFSNFRSNPPFGYVAPVIKWMTDLDPF